MQKQPLVEGRALCWSALVDHRGKCPFADFVRACQPAEKEKLLTAVQRVADLGLPTSEGDVKAIKGVEQLFRLRVGPFRILYFPEGPDARELVITHVIRKRGDLIPRIEIERAVGMRTRFREDG